MAWRIFAIWLIEEGFKEDETGEGEVVGDSVGAGEGEVVGEVTEVFKQAPLLHP